MGGAWATCRGRGLGHVPVGGAGATCRWAGPGLRAPEPTSGRQGSRVRQEGARLPAAGASLQSPLCCVRPRSLWEPCCSHSGWERTWRRLERPQSRLDLACFPLTNRGPSPWTLSGLGGALAGARPRGPRLPPGLEDGLSVWAPDAPGSGREEALPSRLSLPRLPRSSNGQCRPAVKSVAQASGL